MHPFDEMKAWVQFAPEDEVLLRGFLPVVKPHLTALSELFYSRIQLSPGASAVLRDDAQIARLKGTLSQWALELVSGPWDDAYYMRRERIGRMHVQVGLHSRYMFTAMNVYRDAMCRIASEYSDPALGRLTCCSISKVADMDLAIMTGTFLESSERRQVSTLQDLLISQMPVTVLLIDGDGRVAAATRPGIRLFGDTPVIGRRWMDALPAPLVRAADLDAVLQRALESGREIALPRVDVRLEGEDRNFHLSVVPLDPTRALLHVEELTEAVRTEGRLVRAESLAQLGALSAAVAHELRNPLAGISGAIQVISRSLPETDKHKPVMVKVEQQVRRLDSLVTDLLDFARPAEARRAKVRLDEIALLVIDLVQRDHPLVDLRTTGEGEVMADANLVQQVLLNLVLNAVQAMDGGAGHAVHLRVRDGSVLVNDDGPGIPEENVEKIFSPFFTTRTRGTGLGLAICRQATAAMGGSLTLSTGDLRGAAFLLELPLV